MDCERYERVVLEHLYGELDGLVQLAATRHVEQCTRCREVLHGLRATRAVGAVPTLQIPDGFTQEVVQAERSVRSNLPWRHRTGHWVSLVASYAMRPQLGMAALAMLMIVSGLVLLRTRHGEPAGASLAQHVVGLTTPVSGQQVYQALAREDAQATEERVAALRHAQDVLQAQGCQRAVPLFEHLLQTKGNSVEAQAALWEMAQCEHRLGEVEAAKRSLRQLMYLAGFGANYDRARAMLDELTTLESPPSSGPERAAAGDDAPVAASTARFVPESERIARPRPPAPPTMQPTSPTRGPQLPDAYREAAPFGNPTTTAKPPQALGQNLGDDDATDGSVQPSEVAEEAQRAAPRGAPLPNADSAPEPSESDDETERPDAAPGPPSTVPSASPSPGQEPPSQEPSADAPPAAPPSPPSSRAPGGSADGAGEDGENPPPVAPEAPSPSEDHARDGPPVAQGS